MLKSDKDDLVDRIENAVNVFGDRIDAFETRVLTAMVGFQHVILVASIAGIIAQRGSANEADNFC